MHASERTPSGRMPFGKHKGERIDGLPDGYLAWLLTIELREPLCSAILAEAERRNVAREQRQPTPRLPLPDECRDVARRMVAVGYKRLATELHPDHGGDVVAMQALNRAAEVLREALA